MEVRRRVGENGGYLGEYLEKNGKNSKNQNLKEFCFM
jgi:hypothetical protein